MTATDEQDGAAGIDAPPRPSAVVLDDKARGPVRYNDDEPTRLDALVVLIYRWRVGLGVLALCLALLVVMANSLRGGSDESEEATNAETLAGPDVSPDNNDSSGFDPDGPDSRQAAVGQVDSDSADSDGVRSGIKTSVPINNRSTTIEQDESVFASGAKSGVISPTTTLARSSSVRFVTSATSPRRSSSQIDDRAGTVAKSSSTTTRRLTTTPTTARRATTTATTARATTSTTARPTTTAAKLTTTQRATTTTRRVTTTTRLTTTTRATTTTRRTTTTASTPASLGISGYSFVNTSGGRISAVQNGGTYSISALGSFSVEASATADAGSVQISHNGGTPRAENVAPFGVTFNSVTGDSWNAWNPGPGRHTITARAFSEDFSGGQSGPPLSVTFTLTN